MSRDLDALLRDAAPAPTRAIDESALVARALRQRRLARVGAIVAGITVVIVGGTLGLQALSGPGEVQIVDDPPPDISQHAVWQPMPDGPVDGRTFPSVVWVDDRLVVWGGEKPSEEQWHDTGAVFDPTTMTWSEMAPAPISARSEHIAVWTGDEMLVCCGRVRGQSGAAAYDPDADRWRELPTSPLANVEFALAVWTGQELIVTGGVTGGGASNNRTTVAYDPDADAWRELAALPEVPGGNLRNTGASAVWTGDQMVVWPANGLRGLAYDPDTDQWSELPRLDVEARPRYASLVWTGDEILIMGLGEVATDQEGNSSQLVGAAYRPATGNWRTLDPGLPPAEGSEGNAGSQAAVWTGSRMLVWTGYLGSGVDNGGSLTLSYDPASDIWQRLDTAPTIMWQPDLAWTGRQLLAIGSEANLILGAPSTSDGSRTAERPSQTLQDAARDGVLPAVAELTFEQRVQVPQQHQEWASVRVETSEGVWVVSRMPRETNELADGCGLGATDDPNAVYRRDVICVVEYGEVLLLDRNEERILRAFPLPGLPPQRLEINDDAVWCARAGDGGLPDSMLCRIDRQTFDWQVRAFPHRTSTWWFTGEADPSAGVDPQTGQLWLPDHWKVDDHDVTYDSTYLTARWSFEDRTLVANAQGTLRYDPDTLVPVPPCDLNISTAAEPDDAAVVLTTSIALADDRPGCGFDPFTSIELLDANGWPLPLENDTARPAQYAIEPGQPITLTTNWTNWCPDSDQTAEPAYAVFTAGPFGNVTSPLSITPDCVAPDEASRLTRLDP